MSDSCGPMDCSLPGSSVHGTLRARKLDWVAISFSRECSQPRNRTWVSYMAGRFFAGWATTSNLTALWSEMMLEMISFLFSFSNLPRLDLWPCMWSILEMFRVHLRKRWDSLFWGEVSYRYQLGLTGPLHHLKFVFPCYFSTWLIYTYI